MTREEVSQRSVRFFALTTVYQQSLPVQFIESRQCPVKAKVSVPRGFMSSNVNIVHLFCLSLPIGRSHAL